MHLGGNFFKDSLNHKCMQRHKKRLAQGQPF